MTLCVFPPFSYSLFLQKPPTPSSSPAGENHKTESVLFGSSILLRRPKLLCPAIPGDNPIRHDFHFNKIDPYAIFNQSIQQPLRAVADFISPGSGFDEHYQPA